MGERTTTTPPPGGKTVTSGGEFLDIAEGEAVSGVIVGSREIMNQNGKPQTRYILRKDGGSDHILPSHWDLCSKLAQVAAGSKVWLRRSGTRKLRGRSQPMVTYDVRDYGPDGASDIDLLK